MSSSIKFQSEPCPICREGTWTPHADGVHTFSHKRKTHKVTGMHYVCCSACGTRGYLPGQKAENKRLIKAYEDTLPDYISPSKILSLREMYMISQTQAARIFKCGPTAFSKWERGVGAPTGPTALLLNMALEHPEFMQALATKTGEKIEVQFVEQAASVPVAQQVLDEAVELLERSRKLHAETHALKRTLGDLCRIQFRRPQSSATRTNGYSMGTIPANDSFADQLLVAGL